jgi:hypothetical protein
VGTCSLTEPEPQGPAGVKLCKLRNLPGSKKAAGHSESSSSKPTEGWSSRDTTHLNLNVNELDESMEYDTLPRKGHSAASALLWPLEGSHVLQPACPIFDESIGNVPGFQARHDARRRRGRSI